MNYESFLESKRKTFEATGVEPINPNPILFPFQSDIVKWALRRGRACLFEDCGLGKTFQSLEWAKQVPGDVLIVAPLNVAQQTIAEGKKLSINVKFCRETDQFRKGISITNYEMLERLDVSRFKGVVLDESSILKNFDGKTRNLIIEKFRDTPFKLACTATPSPNDHMELGNHAEFVGAMTRTEMLSMFFVHDGGETSKWRLKGHAEKEFWKWVCSWAVMIRKPSDLGYDDGAFNLPRLKMVEHVVKTDTPMEGHLIPMPASSLQERRNARRNSLGERVEMAAKLIEGNSDQWVFWCNLNAESEAITKAVNGAEIRGDTPMDERERICAEFLAGNIRCVITKGAIWGYGLNLQNCARTACVGISDSYEELYQLIRRFWRFGQTREVEAHIIISDMEGAVLANIKRKEADATKMAVEMVKHMSKINEANIKGTGQTSDAYVEDVARGKGWELYLGDCVEVCKKIEAESVGYSIFSPPFASLYTYSASDRDLGNVMSDAEFHEHFKFVIAELYRVMMAGRLVSFHCMDMPSMKSRDGMIGLKDFPAILIAAFQAVGFIYHSRVVIWKDPLIEATRTKALGLMHKQIIKDSAMCRHGLPDYLITMRKPGDNPKPIAHPNGFDRFIGEDEPKARKGDPVIRSRDIESYAGQTKDDPVYSHQVWRRYASPVWMDINQTRTLQKESARDERDERHICPLQLDVIERAMELWSNPGDLVLSPFAGIGSEGHVALLNGRRFVGAELKASYWKQAAANLEKAEQSATRDLFAA